MHIVLQQLIAYPVFDFQLAPPVPLLDDFIYHWKMVMKFYVNRDTVSKTVIEGTNIPAHLDQLLKVGWKTVDFNRSQIKRFSQVVSTSVSYL